MSSFQKSEESCCLLQNSNQPSKAGGGWGARFSVTNDILWLQNFEAFIWQPWESKKKKKKSHNDRMFLFKRQLHQWKKQHSNYRENQALAYGWNAFMSTAVLAHQKNLKLHTVLYDRYVSCQPQGTAWERRAGDEALKAAGQKLALCRHRRSSSKACKAVKHSFLQQTNLRNINMNEKLGFLSEPMSACVKEALRVISKRQNQKITEGSWQGCT